MRETQLFYSQTRPHAVYRYLARSSGVGDYVSFEGRGISFDTDLVPGDEQRDQVRKQSAAFARL